MARGLKKLVRMDDSDFTDSEVVHLNPVEAMPQTIGQLLQIKREEFGVDLREAAGYLNIRYTYLLAIEEGRVDELPGAAYAMGFVRTYADYLGLDGPAIVERYKDETAELADDIRLVFPSPLPEGKVPSGTIILVAILSLVLVYAGWAIFAQQNVKLAELVPALPERFVSLLNSDKPGEGSEPAVEARTETASDASKPSAIEVTPPTPPVSVSLSAETPPTESAVPAKAAGAPAPSNVAIAETPAAAQSEPVRIPTETVPAVDESVPGVVNPEPKTVIRPGAVAVASAAESVSESGVETPVSTPELAGSHSAPSATIVAPVETTSAAGSSAATEITPQVTEPQASSIVPVDQVDTPTIPRRDDSGGDSTCPGGCAVAAQAAGRRLRSASSIWQRRRRFTGRDKGAD